MAIAQTRYVSIISGVGGGAAVRERELIARFYSENPLIPTNTVLEFTSADDVKTYFGSASTEYLRALFYFGWVSKNITSPQKVSFYFWPNVATGSLIFGKPATYALGSFTGIAAGDFTLQLGGFTHHISGVDLTGAGSLAAVAADIQAAVRAFSGGGTAWTGATVTYDATRGCFDLVSGTTGNDIISITAGSVTDLAGPLGWLTGAIFSNGAAIETVTDVLDASANISNNFGSFTFIPTLDQDGIVEAATWNNAQNVLYQYSVRCTSSNASALSAALFALEGVELTLAPLTVEYPEQVPMMILAATDYTRRNAVQNYMFQNNFNLTPSVNTDADANTYDALRVNYYGQTQSAGQFISFYQRGVMMGGSTALVDQNIYANEQWFKDAAAAALLSLLLALAQVSANKQGRSQILAVLQGIIDTAIFNGTISIGKPLNTDQKLFIANVTGDPNAWQQVQNSGYWVDCVIESFVTEDSRTEWKAVYTLVYSKNDAIRKIEGTHISI